MFEILGTLFTSIISGGATGIFGGAVQRYFDLKKMDKDLQLEKQRGDQELALRRLDSEIMVRESEAKVQIAEINATAVESQADAQAFAASFQEKQYSDAGHVTKNQGWVLIALDFIRGMVRPTITVYLCIITTLVYFHARDLLKAEGVVMDVGSALKLVELVVGTILYLTTTCVLWWFGTRNKQKPPRIK